MSAPDRRGWLDRDHPELSVRRQCVLLGVARSSVYRPARPDNDNNLMLSCVRQVQQFGHGRVAVVRSVQ